MLDDSIKDAALRECWRRRKARLTTAPSSPKQLLAFGRRQPLNPKLHEIGALVLEFLDLLRRTLGETIELRTIAPASPLLASLDASQFQNAVLNLVINAPRCHAARRQVGR